VLAALVTLKSGTLGSSPPSADKHPPEHEQLAATEPSSTELSEEALTGTKPSRQLNNPHKKIVEKRIRSKTRIKANFFFISEHPH